MNSETKKDLIFISIFSIAMGVLEAIVVVYLRQLFYPQGFEFPLTILPVKIYIIEVVREICTILMLFSIAFIAGKNRRQKAAWFLMSFGLWDIFYYVALKIFLNWPESLLTWDILFLIPIIWLGPVLAPIVCSLVMIILSLVILKKEDMEAEFSLKMIDGILVFSGFFMIFLSFIWNYTSLLITGTQQSPEKMIYNYIPQKFLWGLFLSGILLICIDIGTILLHGKNINEHNGF